MQPKSSQTSRTFKKAILSLAGIICLLLLLPVTEVLAADPGPTTTILGSTSVSPVYGQVISLTATVTGEGGIPTGSVSFKDGENTLGTDALDETGKATFSVYTLTVGSHSITADFITSNTAFASSSSAALSHTVSKAITTTTITSSDTSAEYGASVIFTAAVSADAPGSGTPTGTITIKDGSTTLGTSTLSAGTATYSADELSLGSHTITATYSGDGNFNTSISAGLAQIVTESPTITTILMRPGIDGVSYSQTLAATGGAAPYTWSKSGTMPPGLTLSTAGKISGTPTRSGESTFHVTVTDSNASTDTREFTIVIRSPGYLYTWGDNASSQLGNNTTTSSNRPVQPSVLVDKTIVTAAVGGAHSLAVDLNGMVYAWGINTKGQVGDGTVTTRKTPEQLDSIVDIIAVAAGSQHSLALDSNGNVYAWGYNSSGQLGINSTSDKKIPQQVVDSDGSGFLTNIVAIAAGSNFSLALKADGTVYAWGSNGDGQLGIGSADISDIPVQVKGVGGTGNLANIVSISAGYTHALALKSDGTVYAWGGNAGGQLGNGSTADSQTPVIVSGLNGMFAVAAGNLHSLAIKSDGVVYAWGKNNYGQLGNNSTTDKRTPVVVSNMPDATMISAANGHSLAINYSGNAYSWGYNNAGQLGIGSTTNKSLPQQIIGLESSAILITGNGNNSMAISNEELTISQVTITTGSVPDGTVGTSYSMTLTATGGSGAYTWSKSSGTLPPGLSIAPTTGKITGTPTTAGDYTFTIKAADSNNTTIFGTASFTVTIEPSAVPVSITTSSLTNGKENTAYSMTLTATGGSGAYTWSKSSGTLPPGLSIAPTTGKITGTPTTAGNYTFTIKAVDSNSTSDYDTASYTVTINPNVTITTVSTSGLKSDVTVKVDNNGYSQNEYHLTTSDGRLSLDIPDGVKLLSANAKPVTSLSAAVINSNITPPTGATLISGYSLGPDGANFGSALTLTFTYFDENIPADVSENSLYIASYVGGQWTKLSSAVDTDANIVSTEISHFSNYFLLGKITTTEPSPTQTATPTSSTPKPTGASPTGQVSPTGQGQPTPTEQNGPDKPFNWWIVIVIIAAVLVILIILLIRSRRRKFGIY